MTRLPLSRPARRGRLFGVVAALCALAVPLVAVPAATAAPSLPVLWEGRVLTPAGVPAEASVAAFARPPADQIRDGVPLTEIARTDTDADGRYILRAGPSALAGVADQGGWATVMVVATGADGMALGVDSVSWKPAGGLGPFAAGGAGSWVSTPQALLADPAALATSALGEPDGLSAERPGVLTLDPATKTTVPFGKRPGGRPPKGETHCAPTPRSTDIGVFPVAVGELHRERDWGGEFVYTSTKSSSFQIGSSADGKGWKMAGSASMSKTSEARASGYEEPTDHLVFETSYAEMVFTKFEWVCGEPNWYKAYTLEPTDWTGGMHDWPGVNPTGCRAGKTAPVPPGDKFERSKGTSQTLQGAISVDGFVGATTTGFTMSVSDTAATGVGEMWKNETTRERQVCGDEKFPAFDGTRVVSLP